MPEVTSYAPGTFCWAELGTTDAAGAKRFYTDLFGWTFEDNVMGPDMVYTMWRLKEKEVGALYQMGKDQQGVPPHWQCYVSVENADATAAKLKELGGNVIAGPFDVMDVGRMAIVTDPEGATFALWQPGKHIGATIVNEPGATCWYELASWKPKETGAFYATLFGWTLKESPEYTEFHGSDGRPRGGMFTMKPEMQGVPAFWMPYFAVADCDAMAQKATAGGGKVHNGPQDIPNVGRFAVLSDPQGAAFSIIKLNRME